MAGAGIDLTPADDRPPGVDDSIAALYDPPAADEPLGQIEDEPWLADDLADPVEEVTEDEVKSWLLNAGDGLNFAHAAGRRIVPEVWKATQADLAAIAPPLTRIINRHPRMAAIAHRSDADGVAVTIAAARYAWRNVSDLRDNAEPEPAAATIANTPRPAEPEPGGEVPGPPIPPGSPFANQP